MLQAVFESVVCLLVCAVTMETMEWDGASASVFELGTWVFSAIVIVTSLRVAMEMHAHSRLFQVGPPARCAWLTAAVAGQLVRPRLTVVPLPPVPLPR